MRIQKIPLLLMAVFFLSFIQLNIYAVDANPSYGDAIVVSSSSDARTFVPILASDSASSDIVGLVFNGLVKYDKDIRIVGDLAESWEIKDNGLTIIFHLRNGVKWHDGYPFSSKDVVFTYSKLIDPLVKTPYSGDFERISSIDAPDKYTVVVHYKEPFSPALSSWGMWIMPEHILRNEDLGATAFASHPIGTGPYKFRSWNKGQKIELVANPDYFDGEPFIKRHIVRIIPDEATAFLELQTQGVDMASVTPLQYARQTGTKFFEKHYNKFKYPSFGYTYLAFNLSDSKFIDKRVRLAINYAINKKEMIDTIYFGLAREITGPFMIDSWAYDRSLKPIGYDTLAARSLLSEAGWRDTDNDGWLDKGGNIFEFTVLVNQGNAERLRCAEMIQGYLKAVGIRMKIRVLEWSALINDFVDKRRFEAVLMGWFLSRDPDIFDIWHSSKTGEGRFNFIGYNNKEVDRLLEEGRSSFDESVRRDAYNKIHQIIYDDQPYIFLFTADALPVVSKRFRNVEVSPIGIGYNFTKWYVPENEQRYR